MTLIQFDDQSGRRIGNAVRFVEDQANRRKPLTFDFVADSMRKPLTLATFKGAWATGESRVVTISGSTHTASVINLCQASRGNGTNALAVIYGKTTAGNSVVEIDPGPYPNKCGFLPGPDLIRVTFQATYGQGAEVRVLGPGGSTSDAGPIQGLQIIDKGHGYAMLGRVEPSVAITGSATGAEFTATMGKTTDSYSLPIWKINSVSLKANGATGYVGGERLTVAPLGGAVEFQPAYITLETQRLEPAVKATPVSQYGVGASVSVSLAASTDTAGNAVWTIASFSGGGGSAYSVGEWVKVSANEPHVRMPQGGSGLISSVGKSGDITGISVNEPGAYYKETPFSVKTEFGGRYYLEDKAAAPYTSPITAVITQYPPSNGTGAKIVPTIDANPYSSDFGKLSTVVASPAGTAYLAFVNQPTLIFGGADLTQLVGFETGVQQILGHTGANCLKWYSVTTCSTAVATVTNTAT